MIAQQIIQTLNAQANSTKCPPNLYTQCHFLLTQNSVFILKWGQWVNHGKGVISKTWAHCSLEEQLFVICLLFISSTAQ